MKLEKTKVCTKCGEEKNVEDFNKTSPGKKYFRSVCKECQKKEYREWYKKNDRAKYRRQYNQANKKQIAKKHNEWIKNNPDKVKEHRLTEYSKNIAAIMLKLEKKKLKIIARFKVCTKCGEEKPIKAFSKDGTNGRGSRCKKCVVVSTLESRKKHLDKHHIYQKNYRKNNQKFRQKRRENDKKGIALLVDSYVKRKFCQGSYLKTKDIQDDELVAMKREHIKLGRILKGMKDENDEGSKKKIG